MDKECTVEPKRECDVRQRVLQVEHELNDLRRQNAGTHERFGERIGELEARDKVQDVEMKNVQKSVDAMSADLREVKVEAREISKQLPIIATQVNAIHETYKAVDADVEKIKGEDGETWKGIKKQILAWGVAVVLAIIAVALGLSKFL